ncbi:MAG: hypothetical protein BWY70_01331 [Bacteroidetes bacterium ADurb.Bin408]|nr:MAG: hypothetical protein BWY70_01331 [Bacteroidetes bacterium ADurb.Bin408]
MKVNLNRIAVYLCIFSVIYTAGCKKEPPVTYPVITVDAPQENQVFTIPDTISIHASILHNKPISFVSIAIVDMALTPVTTRYFLYPEMNNYEINSNIIISNPEITSGNYYLHIRASDGSNETNAYTKIYLYETPRILSDIFLITKNAYGTIDISSIDTALMQQHLTNINTDFGFADVDPVNQLLYISGRYNSKLFCYNYNDKVVKWDVSVTGYPPSPYFNDLKVYNKKCYCVLRQNAIIAYNSQGLMVYNNPTSTERYPDKLHFHNNYLFTSQYAISGTNAFILLNYIESGGFYQMLLLNLKTIKFFSRDNNSVYIFANNASDYGEIRIYDIESNGVWEPYNLTGGKLIAAEKVDNNTYLLAYENKVVKFTYNPIGAVDYCIANDILNLKFDDINQKLYIITKNKKIKRYSYPFAQLEKEINVNDSICDILLIYNK